MKTMIRPILIHALLCGGPAPAQVPLHNSLPSASAVIYLDFDGHTVTGTSFNWNGPIYCAASALDPQQITEVFHRMAEDYRPFDLNITTDSLKFLAAPVNRRLRVIFTTSSAWYGNAGGVSMVNSFTYGDDTPAFVFTSLLGNQTRYVGEAASHEAGHALGLYHQVLYDSSCVQVNEYNPGTGSGEIGWAPIMGVAYYRNMTVWHNGPNFSGCISSQDELSVITTQNGFGYRPDDHSSDFRQAKNINLNNGGFIIDGIIEKTDDEDYFRLHLQQDGGFSILAIPFNLGENNYGSNLDLQVSLFNRNKELLATYNPGFSLSTIVDTFLLSDFYYLKVEGRGNLYAPDYASLGSYRLQGGLGTARNVPGPVPVQGIASKPDQASLKPADFPQLLGNMVKASLQVAGPGLFDFMITDLNGTRILNGKVNRGKNTVNLPYMARGTYFIRFLGESGSVTHKFLVQ
jgi:hypothetical protein